MQYAYGKPSDKIGDDGGKKTKVAPTINFVMNGNSTPQIDNTIDITEDE